MTTVLIRLPIRTKNPLNGAQGFSGNATYAYGRERKRIRSTVRLRVWTEIRQTGITLPCAVTVTRISSGMLNAWDGLPAALKNVVDGIADAFGTVDEDPRFTWCAPQQRRCKRGEFGIEIRIEPAEAAVLSQDQESGRV